MSEVDFHYAHLIERKPPVVPVYTARIEKCLRCGAEFEKKSAARKRCDACREIVTLQQQAKANQKLKARRAARRALTI